jgi:hypothetical protein
MSNLLLKPRAKGPDTRVVNNPTPVVGLAKFLGQVSKENPKH